MRQAGRVIVALILIFIVLRIYVITNSPFVLVLMFIMFLSTLDAKIKSREIVYSD
jgi:hypothetical protein